MNHDSALPEIERRLANMPEPWRSVLAPYTQVAAARGAAVDPESHALLLGPRPKLGRYAHDICMFPPATPSELAQYEESLVVSLPMSVKAYLLAFNGGMFFQFSVWGADHFYAQHPWPAKERPRWHCADIGTDLVIRRRRSSNAVPMLGARNVTLNEVHHYFPLERGVVALDSHGKQVDSWPDMENWLKSELSAAAAFTEEWSNAMAELLKAQ
ncbi:SMI1/KNR4 family protein [Piscinibacterium candidicorallinum]|uniref:SMI1/KNR4 family protein n=1 Tax=Piscinibacterium candidicorallinum TaxID=1793872 RepID=A0ABV7H8F9_9BURK